MTRRKFLIVALAALAVLAVGSSAEAIKLRAGNIIITADGGFTPTKLPRHENAPITIHGGGKISTVTGELPPILETIDIEFDRHGAVDTTGLPVCTAGPARGDDRRAGAAPSAAGAIVGKGSGKRDRQVPRTGADPGLLADHDLQRARRSTATRPSSPTPTSTVPVPTTFIVPVVIEKIHKGVYGYRTQARIPKIAGGAGDPDLGRTDDRQKMDLQGQEAQLHQRPLRNRPPPGPRPVHASKTAPSSRDLPPALPGARA